MTARAGSYLFNGGWVPRVTRVTSEFSRFGGVPRDVLDRACERGTKVDQAIMLYADDNLDEDQLDPVLVPYLEGWKKAVDRYQLKVLAKQRVVFHPVRGYGGRLDLVVEMGRPPAHVLMPDLVVTELKCVDTVGPEVALQLAAYQAALNYELERHSFGDVPMGRKAHHRLTPQLLPEGEFRPHWHDDPSDFTVFVGCLNRLNFLIRNGYETLD